MNFFFSSRRRHTRFDCDWSSDVCSSDLQRDVAMQAFEKTYPADPRALVAMRLRHFLDVTSDLSFDAQLVDKEDRKSTRLNSSHSQISYAVFCLKKKKKKKKSKTEIIKQN